jgi:hypothetical protein
MVGRSPTLLAAARPDVIDIDRIIHRFDKDRTDRKDLIERYFSAISLTEIVA